MKWARFKPYLIAVALIVAAGLIIWLAKYTVASGEKRSNVISLNRGYKIEQYMFRNGMRLTIWNSQGMSWSYEGETNVKNVVEERWLSGDRGIYLNLILERRDSMTEEVPVKVIYDFQRGELYTVSPWGLWRLWNSRMPEDKNWMKESEFQAILVHMEHDEDPK